MNTEIPTTESAQNHSSQENRPGMPGFVERRKRRREPGTIRRTLVGLGITAVVFLGMGHQLGMQMVPEVELNHHNSTREVAGPIDVKVISPREGGLPRKIVQTGTIEAIARAELRARVSGYVKKVFVDIGDTVKEGDLLAELATEDLLKDVEKEFVAVELAETQVKQQKARLVTIVADQAAAEGALTQVKAEVSRRQARLMLNQKELGRIRSLHRYNAIEENELDKTTYEWQAAEASLAESRGSQVVAEAELNSIIAKVDVIRADIAEAEAKVRVAKANLSKAKVMAGFRYIRSPFDGTITDRGFDRGDFVQAATRGAQPPILTVAKTDHMRAVLQISAPDAPFVHPGNEALVRVSSLGNKRFTGTISRIAGSQNRRTRTMRVEVDLPNPHNLLAQGMYGAISIQVPAPTNEMSIPVSCLVGRALNGHARVYKYIDGHVELHSIGVGRTYMDRIEVLDGIEPEDLIVSGETEEFGLLRDGNLAVILPQAPEDSEISAEKKKDKKPAGEQLAQK